MFPGSLRECLETRITSTVAKILTAALSQTASRVIVLWRSRLRQRVPIELLASVGVPLTVGLGLEVAVALVGGSLVMRRLGPRAAEYV